MPAEFAPRGTHALQAAQVMGQQMLQAAAIRATNEREARDREARQRMQQQAIAAEQTMQGQRMAFSYLQQQQEAKLQEARDARLNQYDLDRLDKVENARKAERTFEETGLTPDSIRQWAENNGRLTGKPMGYDDAYRTLAGYKQQERVQQEMTAKLDYLDRVDANKLSRQEREVQKKINTLNDWESEIVSDPGSSDAVKKQTRDYAKRGRIQLLTGVKLPPPEPTVQEWAKENTIPGSNGAIRIQKSDGSFDIRQLRNVGNDPASKDVDTFYKDLLDIKEDDVNNWLDNSYAVAFKSDPNVGVWDDDIGGKRAKTTKKDPDKVIDADRSKAREDLIRKRLASAPQLVYEAAISKAATRYVMQGISPEEARVRAEEDMKNRGSDARTRIAGAEAKTDALADDNLSAQGKPKKYTTSQPASGDDDAKVAELQAALSDPSVPESTKDKIRSALGG
jgi:hypothetical protein